MSLAFQSFVFPPVAESAQVAFLNTIPGDSLESVMKMQDGVSAVVREENVMFNKVYAIEEGKYNLLLSKHSLRHLALNRGKDYVILKTGTSNHPQLLVFPDDTHTGMVFINLYSLIVILALCLAVFIAGYNGTFQKWREARGFTADQEEADEYERVPLNA